MSAGLPTAGPYEEGWGWEGWSRRWRRRRRSKTKRRRTRRNTKTQKQKWGDEDGEEVGEVDDEGERLPMTLRRPQK